MALHLDQPGRAAARIRSRAGAVGAQHDRADPPGAGGRRRPPPRRRRRRRAAAVRAVVGVDDAATSGRRRSRARGAPGRPRPGRRRARAPTGSRCRRRRRRARRRGAAPSALRRRAARRWAVSSSALIGGDEDQVELGGVDAGAGEGRAPGRGGRSARRSPGGDARRSRMPVRRHDPVLVDPEARGDRGVGEDGLGQRRAQRVQPRGCPLRRRAVQRSCADGEFGHAGNVPRRPALRPPDRGPFPPAGGKFPRLGGSAGHRRNMLE